MKQDTKNMIIHELKMKPCIGITGWLFGHEFPQSMITLETPEEIITKQPIIQGAIEQAKIRIEFQELIKQWNIILKSYNLKHKYVCKRCGITPEEAKI